MYIKKTGFCFFLLLTILSLTINAYCQDNLKTITASFNQYQQDASQEKLFVHTDKSYYIAGEILWFKIYAADITLHKPIDISKVAYVEVLDTNNQFVMQAKIGMDKGTGDGSFYLPLTLHSGNYMLRAYTNWMKNAGPECFFEKVITIVNVQSIAPLPVKEAITYDVQFFPEGGNLVAGLESKMAFKVWDSNGKGISATGTILDNGNTLTTFSASHAGMGNFILKPAANHTYKAVVQTGGGNTITKELPQVYATGMAMRVSNAGEMVNVQVQANGVSTNTVYLIVHAGALIEIAESGTLQNGSINFTFHPSKLVDGISHITLFNANKQPMCERAYFKQPAAYLNITSTTSQTTYKKRDKVTIALTASNLNPHDTASLSMAVYRLDSIQTIDANTIDAYLLLSSGLKGPIEEVQSYFTKDKQASEYLDNLLLVNGWSRFKWEAALNNTKPMFTYIPEYKGHIVTGKVTNSKTGTGEKEVETYLSVPGLKTQWATALSDEEGNIRFELTNFAGSSEIIAQTKAADVNYKIQINNPFSNAFTGHTVPPFSLPRQSPNTLNEQSISMQVQNIYALKKLNQFYPGITDTAVFYLTPDSRYLLDNYTRFTTMEEVLREYVALVNVTKREGHYHIQVYDKGHGTVFTGDPLVLLDGVPILNMDNLFAIDPLKLKSLEVVQKKYFVGPTVADGILNWKSYNGDMGGYELDPAAVVMDYEGLQLKREFYSPVYTSNPTSPVPDFRNVLYWNPNLKLSNGKDLAVSFYTSDLPGKYVVVVQGLSSSGLCGSTMSTFEVKE